MEQIAENIYVETAYDGVNVGAIVTRQGIIAIDVPSYPRQAREWAMRLHTLTHRPLQYVILTDYHGDRIVNTRWLNAPIITHRATAVKLQSYDKRYPTALLESLAMRKPEYGRELSNSPGEKPAISFSHDARILKGNSEIVCLSAPGPTFGNIWVYLPQKEILFSGDTVTVGTHPLLAEKSSKAWLQTCDRLQHWPYPVHIIVPGRGPLTTIEAAVPIRQYLTQMREQISQHWLNGRSREETAAYVPEFMPLFPQNGLPTEWLQAQIASSLAHVYDEIQLEQRGAMVPLL